MPIYLLNSCHSQTWYVQRLSSYCSHSDRNQVLSLFRLPKRCSSQELQKQSNSIFFYWPVHELHSRVFNFKFNWSMVRGNSSAYL